MIIRKSLSLLLAVSMLVPAPFALAQTRSILDPDGIIHDTRNLYECYHGRCTDQALQGVDVARIADVLADDISQLRPTQYNDVLMHIAADYARNPRDRRPIELLFETVHSKVAQELRENREFHPLDPILRDVFIAWTVGSIGSGGYGLVRGIWKTRGQGLTRTRRFLHVLKSTARGRRGLTFKFVAAGGTIGVVQAVAFYVTTKRLNPRELLRGTQEGVAQNENPGVQRRVLNELAQSVASTRDFLESVDGETIQRDPELWASHIRDAEAFLRDAQEQLEHLYEAAAHLRSHMVPVGEDITTGRNRIERLKIYLPLEAQLGDNDFDGDGRDDLEGLDDLGGLDDLDEYGEGPGAGSHGGGDELDSLGGLY